VLPADNFILPLLGRERQLPEAFARLAAKWLLSGENPHGLFQHPSMNFRICLRLVWTEEGFYRSRKEWASITSSVWGWLFWFLLAFLVFFVFFFFLTGSSEDGLWDQCAERSLCIGSQLDSEAFMKHLTSVSRRVF